MGPREVGAGLIQLEFDLEVSRQGDRGAGQTGIWTEHAGGLPAVSELGLRGGRRGASGL